MIPLADIYVGDEITDSYRDRYSVNFSVERQADLIINNTEAADAGLYVCTEDAGVRHRYCTPLPVRGNDAYLRFW